MGCDEFGEGHVMRAMRLRAIGATILSTFVALPAAAQDAGQWQFEATPYLWAGAGFRF
jgi:hypothetical protein